MLGRRVGCCPAAKPPQKSWPLLHRSKVGSEEAECAGLPRRSTGLTPLCEDGTLRRARIRLDLSQNSCKVRSPIGTEDSRCCGRRTWAIGEGHWTVAAKEARFREELRRGGGSLLASGLSFIEEHSVAGMPLRGYQRRLGLLPRHSKNKKLLTMNFAELELLLLEEFEHQLWDGHAVGWRGMMIATLGFCRPELLRLQGSTLLT